MRAVEGRRSTGCSPSLGLVLLSPLFAGLALWIVLESGRPVIFRQRARRQGRRRRSAMLKFRTMVANAVELGRELELTDDPFGLLPNDPRITAQRPLPAPHEPRRAAAALERAARPDEPRRPAAGPRRAGRELRAARDRRRLAVKPGHHRLGAGERAATRSRGRSASALDAWYVDNWSLGLDARIVLMTFTQLGRAGAGAGRGHAEHRARAQAERAE